MQLLMIDVCLAVCAAAIGASGMWWLCGRRGQPQIPATRGGEERKSIEVLTRLHELATRVAVDVIPAE
jgi:hypothetical protein